MCCSFFMYLLLALLLLAFAAVFPLGFIISIVVIAVIKFFDR